MEENNINDILGRESSQSQSNNEENTFNPDEKILGVVGQKFLTSLMIGNGFSTTSLMVTNKRLYASAKSYTTKGKSYQTLVGEIKDLKSIGIEYKSNFWLMILGIILTPLYGLGIILIVYALRKRKRFIQFNFGGDTSSLSLRGISNEEVAKFIKIVMLAKGNEIIEIEKVSNLSKETTKMKDKSQVEFWICPRCSTENDASTNICKSCSYSII
ncbi:MAG: hypothetical protein M0R21_02470 [Lentimicrobiaceae bacterium]|nr:hypothetical protein [Lentimicrobiaceae bacterium]